MRITNNLLNQVDKLISLLRSGKIETAVDIALELRGDLEKIEVFSRWKFEMNEVIRERGTGFMVKVKGLGHSSESWGYKVEYLNPENEPTAEYRKPEWRPENEFEKANRAKEIKVDTAATYGPLLNRLKFETREAEIGL